MPCFKGLAVSIHTPDGPLPEFSIQKQSRQSRITSYIPVPPPKIDTDTGRPEPSTFAVSITLLSPGQAVPYSTPKATTDNPSPGPKIVGGLPGLGIERGKYGTVIGPYMPLTTSGNETVAAYIHFDGRAKEEVATLLRRSEETWVNSRWVSVPSSEGGGLAEREFLFREVGLERWLSGMDISGSKEDIAARIARRKLKLEKKRRKRLEAKDSDDEGDDITLRLRKVEGNGILRYGEDKQSPLETLEQDDDLVSSESDSEDEEPIPEAAGQIKVALFRVLASGEVKRGEYSPQFDAHDDDEMQGAVDQNADVDHTTTFAKPKSLDPKSISTQTVTGIDAPDNPYATFTFFYRGQKQLQKMGILPDSKHNDSKTTNTSKRKSAGIDFGNLAPLKAKGTIGFAGYRDTNAASATGVGGKKTANDDDDDDDDDDMDSEHDDDRGRKKTANGVDKDDDDLRELDERLLTPEELKRRQELAEGVKKLQLKRQHSAEPSSMSTAASAATPPSTSEGMSASAPTETSSLAVPKGAASHLAAFEKEPSDLVGSPMKKQRASVSQPNEAAAAAASIGSSLFGASASTSDAPELASLNASNGNRESLDVDKPGSKLAETVNAERHAWDESQNSSERAEAGSGADGSMKDEDEL